jgi:putative ABC transport system permease protein
MRLRQSLYLTRKNLRQNLGRAILACLGVGVGMAIVLASLSLGWGVHAHVLKRLREAMPERILSARRAHMDVGPLRIQGKPITEAEVERLRALEEVKSVWPQIPITFPIHAEGELLGVHLSTDVVVNGVAPALARGDVAPGKTFAFDPEAPEPVPVLVSRYVMDLYNLGYAEANGLPKLSEAFVIGRTFRIVLGQSTMPVLGDDPEARAVECVVVGLTGNPSLLGVTMPAGHVAAFNREFSAADEPQYNALHIELREVDGLERVEEELREMSLRPDSQRELLRRLQFFLRILLLTILVFSALVLTVAMCNVANTFSLILLQRRFEIGLLRAVGATRGSVVRLFLTETAALGAAGGAFGAVVAFCVTAGVNHLCRSYLPPLSLLPADQQVLIFGWPLALAGVAFAAAASMASTLPIVLRETARAPAVLLRQD